MKKLILLLILIAGTLVVSGQKIEDLTRATTTVATDLLIIDQTATTSGISIGNFFNTVLFGDGTVLLPSISLLTDPNTGVYTTGADIFNITAGGKEGIRIDGAFGGVEVIIKDTLTIESYASPTAPVLSVSPTGVVDTTATADVADLTLNTADINTLQINTRIYVDGVVNFAADAQGNDDYEIDIPGITALVAGLQVTFLANTANTDGATLEITSVGDLDAILKQHDTVLTSNDIEAGSIVVCVWDGSNWQMVSPVAN